MTQPPVTEIDIRTQAAEAGLKRLESAFKAVGASGDAFSAELNAQQLNFLKLTARTDEAARARLQFESAERRIGAAFDAGKINAVQYNAALDQQIARLERAAQRQQGFAQTAQGAAGAGRNFGAAIGQAGFQVQDFAVQVASGQSAVTALAQQGSQLLGVFGTGGAIAGAALAIGAIAFKLGDWRSAAEKAAEASDKLDESIKAATETMDRQVRLGRELVEQQGRELDRTADLARYYLSLDDATRKYEMTRLRLRRLELEERRDAARGAAGAATAGVGRQVAARLRPDDPTFDPEAGMATTLGPRGGEQGARIAEALAEFEAGGEIARLYDRIFAISTETEGAFTKELRAMLPVLEKAAEQAREAERALRGTNTQLDTLAKPREEQERLAADTTKARAESAREAAEQERARQREESEAQKRRIAYWELEGRRELDSLVAGQKALDQVLKRQAAFDEWLAALEREAELSGQTKEIREEELKLVEARAKAGRDLTADEEMRVRRAVETKQANEAQRKAAKETADFIETSFDRAFDRVGDAAAAMALDGKDAFASLANVGRAVAASLYTDFIKLAAINPLKNMIFGGNAPTLGGGGFFSGLFSGGGGAGAGNSLATVGGAGFTGGTFATGGDHLGGLRMVGERGPEIEATGPARIWSAEQTRAFLQGGRGRVIINDNRAGSAPDLSISETADGDVVVTIQDQIRKAAPGIVDASVYAVAARMRRGQFP
ncbi:MAG: hypothetical protein ING19_20850 [Azospirillum sp.]|nr:hypothetical protein [Azospirillum sp.]MCA3268501.1 hypothetical protein [Azospirillum sp.]